jgi:hypothetical protein
MKVEEGSKASGEPLTCLVTSANDLEMTDIGKTWSLSSIVLISHVFAIHFIFRADI